MSHPQSTKSLRIAHSAVERLAAVLLMLSIAALLLPAAPVAAVPVAPVPSVAVELSASEPGIPTVDRETLGTRLTELEQIAEPGEADRKELDILRRVLQFLLDAEQEHERAEEIQRSMLNAPGLIAEMEHTLEQPIETPQIASRSSQQELERQLSTAKAQFDIARQQQEALEEESASRAQRRPLVPEEIAATHARLYEVRQTLGLTTAGDTTQQQTDTQQLLYAEHEYLEALRDRLQVEQREIDEHADLQRVRRQLAKRRVLEGQRLVEALGTIVDDKRAAAADQARLMAELERRATVDAEPAVRALVEQDAALAKELEVITERTRALAMVLTRVDNERSRWASENERAKKRLAKVGLADAVGIRLRRQRRELPSPRALERRAEQRRSTMVKAQIQQLALEDRLLELVDVDNAAQRLLKEYPSAENVDRDEVLKALREAISTQKYEYLTPLIKAYDRYVGDTLLKLHESEAILASLSRSFREFIDERVFWIQSAPALGGSEFVDDLREARLLLVPENWAQVYQALREDVSRSPWILPPGLLLFVAIVLYRRRLKRLLAGCASVAYRRRVDQWMQTVTTTVLTVALATIWPFLLWLLGWRMGMQSSQEELFAHAFASALNSTATLLFVIEMLRNVCRRDSLAERHWSWSAANIRTLRRNLSWAGPVAILLMFVVSLTAGQPVLVDNATVGRLAFLALMVVTALFFARIFHPRYGLLHERLQATPDGWLAKLRNVWYPLVWGLPATLGVLAASGYYYTAIRFSTLTFDTICLVLGVIFVYETALRWLRVTRARLALVEARQKRAADPNEAHPVTVGAEMHGESAVETEETLIHISTISDQTTNLLRSLSVLAMVLGIAWIWSDVLPALNVLRSVELWEVSAGSDAAGAESDPAAQEQVVNKITLAEIALAILVMVITVVLARNVPGMLEFTVLQRLPISASGRLAIVSSVRYLLVVVGTIMTFNAIGIGWSKVQWLVAAISLGLGFGLQEIFANFVSGLIILYERPIRVGDIVTLGNVDGQISRIRIRATTVTDWDNKELIVPNKEFITGRLVNWTLTDPITRVMIPFGLAHGSDTELVHRLLMRAAKECPFTLEEPPPGAIFRSIGDSALLFQLRVFIDGMDSYLDLLDDIHTRVDTAFRAAGIKIAYPQRDIHIRTLEGGLPLTPTVEPASAN